MVMVVSFSRHAADTAVELGPRLALLEMISLLLDRKVREKVVVRWT
jgi:hypothetical protein